MVPSLHPQLAKIVRAVRVSNELSKVASAEAALTKVAVDAEIFGMANFSVKTASISNPVQEMANKMSELAISIYGFNKLSGWFGPDKSKNHFEPNKYFVQQLQDSAKELKEMDPRNNKPADTVIAGRHGYILYNAKAGMPKDTTRPTKGMSVVYRPTATGELSSLLDNPKTAAVTMNPILADAATKMATVGAIEGLLNLLPNTLSEETQKLAMEIRALNRGYGATILNDLLV